MRWCPRNNTATLLEIPDEAALNTNSEIPSDYAKSSRGRRRGSCHPQMGPRRYATGRWPVARCARPVAALPHLGTARTTAGAVTGSAPQSDRQELISGKVKPEKFKARIT